MAKEPTPEQATDEQLVQAWAGIERAVSHLPTNKEKAIAAIERGLRYLAAAIKDEGKDVTDKSLLSATHAMVAGWILAQERATKEN